MAGTVIQQDVSAYNNIIRKIRFLCTGDATNGAIPDTVFNSDGIITGWYIYCVSAYPLAGGKAPDAASVFILDANGEDLLGSPDGGTTAANGLNLIHATLKKTCLPYVAHTGANFYFPITGALTLRVSGQATVSANWVIEVFASLG